MAPINKKTYSRSNNDSHLLPEKQNVDPFDELLSSPLKQEVKFKPLKFWTEKTNSSRFQSNFSKARYGLFETSDSEELNSPFKKKKKVKSKSLEVGKRNHPRTKHQHFNEKVNNSVLPCNSITISGGDKPDISCVSRTFDDSRSFSFKYVTFRRDFNLPVFDDKTNSLISDKTFQKEGCILNPKIQDSENHNKFPNPEIKGRLQDISSVNSKFIYCETLPGNNVWGYQSDEEAEHYENCRSFQSTETFDETLLGFSNNSLGITEISDQPSGTKWENSIFSSISTDKSYMSNDTTLQTLQSESPESASSEYDTVLFQSALSSNSPTTDKGNESIYQVDIITQKTVQDLSRRMSNIRVSHANPSIGKASENDSGLQDEPGTTEVFQESNFKHVTRRRRLDGPPKNLTVSSDLQLETPPKPIKKMKQSDSAKDTLLEESIQSSPLSIALKNRISNADDRFSCLSVPVFESTRVMNDSQNELEKCENVTLDISVKINEGSFENSLAFKSGKKWLRSMSVLRQIQNGSLSQFNVETAKVKGKNYKNFVQEIIGMQNDISSLSIHNSTVLNKTSRTALVDSDSTNKTYALRHLGIKKKDDNLSLRPSASTNDSWFSSLICNKSSLNHTVKVIEPENSFDKPSSFRRALGIEGKSFIENTVVGEKENESSISPRDFILAQCGQEDVLPFEEYFNKRTLKKCKKIGEGVYGEVFMCNTDTVIKIIPIEGSDLVNGEPQKKFEEIVSEVVIASKLSDLRKGEKYRTSGFSELKRCWCVVGKYPKYLLDLWNQYDQSGTGSENDSPVMFKSDQLYIILELANGGKDLEAFVFSNADQSLSIFIQTAYSLAAAEKMFEFEHRDLHWGNLLIAPTKEKYMIVILDGVEYKIPTKGVKVSIIDFTLSRISHEGCCIFNDLSIDPSFFTSQGDYQFEIYRMMQKAVRNDWSSFEPKTNLFWLHYILDKMVKLVRYENKISQIHKKSIKKLKVLEDIILEHEDSFDFVLNQSLV